MQLVEKHKNPHNFRLDKVITGIKRVVQTTPGSVALKTDQFKTKAYGASYCIPVIF